MSPRDGSRSQSLIPAATTLSRKGNCLRPQRSESGRVVCKCGGPAGSKTCESGEGMDSDQSTCSRHQLGPRGSVALYPRSEDNSLSSCERALQPCAGHLDQTLGIRHNAPHRQETVDLPREGLVHDGHASRKERLGVSLAFVAQRIEARGDDEGRREILEACCSQR